MRPAEAFVAAVQHHQAGQFAEADRLYRKVIAAEPNHVHALHLRGALAHAAGRNEEAVELIGRALALNEQVPDFHYNVALALWALGRRPDAMNHWTRAVALNPNFVAARLNLGNALRDEGRLDEAIAQHRAAMQLQPQSPPVHNSLGLSLAKAARHDEAIPHYSRAIALQPGFVDAYLNLAQSHLTRGEVEQALGVTMRSIDIRETPENKAMFVRLVAGLEGVRENATLRRFMVRALSQSWGAPSELVATSITLIRHGPLSAPIARAVQAWPARLPGAERFHAGLAANDPLLQALMNAAVICDADLEKFLSACRFALLDAAEAASVTSVDATVLGFACALARQCYINEYVYTAADDEAARALNLQARLDAALVSGADISPLWVVAVAMYFPLHQLAAIAPMLEHPWPAAVAALLTQQVAEPREEASERANIRQLTPIDDGVSRAVQTQYEENPYPRWIRPAAPRQFAGIDAYLREAFPSVPVSAPGRNGSLDILIAGCGTGQHAIATAQQYAGARTLAIDLSRASLGYAAAKTRALGLDIDYAQADIMRLGAIERRFDLIETMGVLHHLADPYAGWRVLLSLLRPGGFMRIALYSEAARWGVVAARELIAQAGYGATPAEIRRFRSDLMLRDDNVARNIMRFNDFYSTSECRDLVFHAQEHRMTLPAIKEFLGEQGLRFLGFEIDGRTAREYAARFPADTAMTDLDCWNAFEQDDPATFSNMYRFWVQKTDRVPA